MAGAKYRDEQEYLNPPAKPIDWAEAYSLAKRTLRGEIIRQDTGNIARTAFGFSVTTIALARAFVAMMENMSWTKEELLAKLGPPEDRGRKMRDGDLGVTRHSQGFREGQV